MDDNGLDYNQIKEMIDQHNEEDKNTDRRKKRDIVSRMPTILALIAWMILAAVWVILDQAAPDRGYGWLSFFEVNFGTAAAHRTRWNYSLVYVSYILLLVSIGTCLIAFVFNKFRMRRKTDKYRVSVFFVGGVSIIAFVFFMIRFWYFIM
jgi:4-amino-4-deoxy-L-arabinose transferase-like glycosyltransferase